MKKKIVSVLIIITLSFLLASCDLLEMFTPKYRVSFYSDNVLVEEFEVKKDSLIKAPTLTVKEGYDFIGWFKDLEDETTKWDFSNDLVNGHLRLDALYELNVNYLNVVNLRIVDDKLVWDEIEDATYIVNILEDELTLDTNELSLNTYKNLLSSDVEVSVLPVKEGFTGLLTLGKVKFNLEETIESYKLEFDEFDFSGFELNRSSYKTTTLNYDDHYLHVEEARLTTVSEEPKVGTVALILRKEGTLELKEGYNNFVGLEFKLGNYQNRTSTSVVHVYLSNSPDEGFSLIKSFNNDDTTGFKTFNIGLEDINNIVDVNDAIYIKFVSDISGKDAENIIIDDVIVYEKINAYYQFNSLVGEVELSDYYSSANGLKGKALVDELRIIISTNLNDIRYSDYKIIGEFADIKLDDEAHVRGIYDVKDLRKDWGSRSEWHREHVWPNSRLGMGRVKESEVNQASDPHNLRAIFPSTNSSRSNRYYDSSTENNPLGHTLSGGRYYPGDLDKGDVSRILLYMVVRYEFLGLTDHVGLFDRQAYTPEAGYMGKLSVLLDWHNEDPVDEFEIHRNEVIFSYQNNRNPFIDHPELFIEVYNYFLSVDEDRTVTVNLYFNFEINYSELINKKEEYVM